MANKHWATTDDNVQGLAPDGSGGSVISATDINLGHAAAATQTVGALSAIGTGVISGWVVSAGTGRSFNVSAGSGIVSYLHDGSVTTHMVLETVGNSSNVNTLLPGPTTITADGTYYVMATMTWPTSVSNGLTAFFAQTSPTAPDGAIAIAVITISGAAVTNVSDLRTMTGTDGSGQLTKSVAGASDVTLSTAEAKNLNQNYTGVLTGNINVIVPVTPRLFNVRNSTTGAFSLTVKTASGTGIAVAQGTQQLLFADGTNVVALTSEAGLSAALSTKLTTTDFASSVSSATVQTTNATVTTLLSHTPTDLMTTTYEFVVVAHKTDHSQGAAYKFTATVRRSGGTVTQINTTTSLMTHEDDAAWDAVMDISSTSVRVRVTGAAATTINWKGYAAIRELG